MSAGRLIPPVSERDHTDGPADASVTLVEYGDYECPHCGQAYPIIQAVQRRLADRLRFVFRHFPLSEMHPHAAHAAEAAEAATDVGKFWEMHDMLFEHQNALDDQSLARYAEAVGAGARRIEAALAEQAYNRRVREDFLSGVRSGVNGTPTFFINGVHYDGPWDEDDLVGALEAGAAATG